MEWTWRARGVKLVRKIVTRRRSCAKSTGRISVDEAGSEVNQTMYKGLIGSLLYLTASRPDIMFVVCLCARFMSGPKESYLKAAKRILKYLKGTISMGLWYPSHSPIHLVGYSDSDFAGCKLDKKSTSETCHLLGSSLISWHSKKQACVALSTAEAEYIAAGSCCAQILWIKQQLEDFGLKINKVPLLCDNTSAVNLTQNQIRHHFILDHINNGDCEIKFVSTESQLADIFTKPLSKDMFYSLRNELGILDMHALP